MFALLLLLCLLLAPYLLLRLFEKPLYLQYAVLLPTYWLLVLAPLEPLSPYSAVEFVVPLPLLAVGLAADLLGAAFQPVSGVDSLLEQPSAVPLPFEQHQPLAVASFLLVQPEHQEFPPLALLLLSVCLMLLMPVFVRLDRLVLEG